MTKDWFKRDQPAVWHVLAEVERTRRMAYKGANVRVGTSVTRTKIPWSVGTGVVGMYAGKKDGRFNFSEHVTNIHLIPTCTHKCPPWSLVLFSRCESSDGYLTQESPRCVDVLAERRDKMSLCGGKVP